MTKYYTAVVTTFLWLSLSFCEGQNQVRIDSTVKEKALQTIDKSIIEGPGGQLDVTVYVNDKKDDIFMLTGTKVPHWSMYMLDGDTTRVLFTNFMGAAFGLVIEKGDNFCDVLHMISDRHGIEKSYKLNLADTAYKVGVSVPCRYTLILNKADYAKGETIYGYIECVSDDFFEKNEKGGDNKRSTGFKGYFQARKID